MTNEATNPQRAQFVRAEVQAATKHLSHQEGLSDVQRILQELLPISDELKMLNALGKLSLAERKQLRAQEIPAENKEFILSCLDRIEDLLPAEDAAFSLEVQALIDSGFIPPELVAQAHASKREFAAANEQWARAAKRLQTSSELVFLDPDSVYSNTSDRKFDMRAFLDRNPEYMVEIKKDIDTFFQLGIAAAKDVAPWEQSLSDLVPERYISEDRILSVLESMQAAVNKLKSFSFNNSSHKSPTVRSRDGVRAESF